MQGGERYNSISNYLIDYFGKKTIKIPIDAGFTCPNRDGSLSKLGCTFCSSDGSGELASHVDAKNFPELKKQITESISNQIEIMSKKWQNAVYLGYLQSHTNTYSDTGTLYNIYHAILDEPRINGLVIATRPDCLGIDEDVESELLNLLEDINKDNFLWVELGLQTGNDKILKELNTCYTSSDYAKAAKALKQRNIRFVTHLILGLPHETKDDMLSSLDYVCNRCEKPFGIKLHLMNLIKNSPLAMKNGAIDPDNIGEYQPYFKSIDEYTDFVVDMLELIPTDITIHRLTGDVPRKLLISPKWSYKKRTILNSINRKLKERDTYQGRLA